MSNDNPTKAVPAAPTAPVTFLITYDPSSGNLNIQGPIANRVLAYGILESAKEAILKSALKVEAQGGNIVVPRGGFGGIFKG